MTKPDNLTNVPGVKGASRTYVLGFFLLLGIAAGLRFWGLDSGLPHLMTRPDEEVLLLKTRYPASGQLDLQYHLRHPGVPSAYIFLLWGAGEVGLPVMQGLGYAPPGDYLHALDRFPARLLLLERILSALAGIATIGALMSFTRRELGGATALSAGAILATCFLHVRESHSAKPDVALGLFAILALGLLARMAREGTIRNAVKAGAAIGFGLAMKPPALLLFVPAWVAGMMSSTAAGWRRLIPMKSIVVGIVAVLIFVATSPDLFTNPETRRQLVNIVYIVFPEFTPEGENAPVAKTEITPTRDVIGGYDYYYNFAYRHGAGWFLWLLTPMAALWGFASRKPFPILCSLFSVVGLVVFAGSTAWQARYLIPLLPGSAVLVAGMLHAGLQRMSPEKWRGPLLAAVTLLVIAQPLQTSAAFDRIVARTDTRGQTTNWVRKNLPAGSIVGVAGTVFWGWGEPWMPGNVKRVPVGLEPGALDDAQLEYLVTHDHPLFSSTIDPELLRPLEPRLELLREFSPFVGQAGEASFDTQDAYYVPIVGLDAVDRPGPVVKIYRVRDDVGRP